MNWRGKGLLAIGIVIIVATAAAVVVMADVLGLAIWSPAQTVAGSAAPTISSDCPPVASGDATALPAALFLGNTPGPVITPQQASRVATAFWPIEEKALAADDRTTTNLIESGPAAEYANAVSCEDILSNHSTRTVRPLQSVNVYVPRQMGYPARFLAEVGTKVYATGPINAPGAAPPPGTPWIDYLVFTRVDESHPWQVVIDTGYSGGVSVDALTPEDASVTPVFDAPPPRPDWIDPSSVPQLLADYWQHWATIGGPPPVDQFTSGFWTTARGAYLQQTKPIDLAKGVVHNNVRYFVDLARDGTYEFAVDNGVDLVCFTVRYEDHLTGVSNAPLLQNDDRDNYGALLPPGVYSSIATSGLHQSCALVPPSPTMPLIPGADAGIAIVGGQGGDTQLEGVKSASALGPVLVLSPLTLLALSLFAVALSLASLVGVLVLAISRRPR